MNYKCICETHWLSIGVILFLRGHLAVLEMAWETGEVVGYLRPVGRGQDAANKPTPHRPGSPAPTTKIYLAQNINRAEVEKPCFNE
jgi:hypothetical protein